MSTMIPCFNCVISDDKVQCSDTESGYHRTIPVEDIVGILPSNGEQTHDYTMLYLQKEESNPGDLFKAYTIRLKSVPPAILSRHLVTEIPSHLSNASSAQLRTHVIVSTGSGTGTAKEQFSNILQPCLAWIGLSRYETHQTESAQSIVDLCQSLLIPQAEIGASQTIILLSGDGGLCDIIDSFHGTANNLRSLPNIALIPTGTGNAMASSIGLVAHPKAALIALLFGKPIPLPVFTSTFSQGAHYVQDSQTSCPVTGDSRPLKIYGCVVASWGMHAALVADSDTSEYRKFGPDRFKMAAKELLFPTDGSETHKYNGTITLIKTRELENEVVEHKQVLEHNEHMYVLATLVSHLEREFVISPQSVPMDGSLRIVRFGPMPSQLAMQVLSAAYQGGQHVQNDDVMYSKIEGFRIDFHEFDERWRRVCIDGRIVLVDQEGWMEVRRDRRSLVNILFRS
ncbi:ATP-NAD kinase-like domain-containing protein [Aspergillus unguis]